MAISTTEDLAAQIALKLNATPVAYGINHVYFNETASDIPWTAARVVAKLSEPPTSYTDGYTILEQTSNSLFIKPLTVSSTSTGAFTVASFTAGTGIDTYGRINTVSFTGGGATTIGVAATTGAIGTTTTTAITSFSYAWTLSGTLQGGTGSGATYTATDNGNGYSAIVVTITSPGSGYSVGDVLTTQPFPNGSVQTFTVTSIVVPTVPVSSAYRVTATNGAVFDIERLGTQGNADAVVALVTVVDPGRTFAVGDTITINSASIGGGANLTITVTSLLADTGYVTYVYDNVPSTLQSGTGSGATFTVTRTTAAGQKAYVTSVVLKNTGSGYGTGSVVTIAASAIGAGSGGDITVTSGATGTAISGNILTFSYGTSAGGSGNLGTGGTILSEANATYTVNLRTATFTITRNSSGAINSVTLVNPGYGFGANAIYEIPGKYIGGSSKTAAQLGVSANYHVYDDGPLALPYVYDTNPRVNPPGKGTVGTYHNGRTVYYALYITSKSAPNTTWNLVSTTSSISVKDSGMFEWFKSHLPDFYFTTATNTDLEDYLKLFAFFADRWRLETDQVFKMTNAKYAPEVLVKQFIKQFGVPTFAYQSLDSLRQVMEDAVKLAATRGTIEGIKTAANDYAGKVVTTTVNERKNLFRDRLNSSFEVNSYSTGSAILNWSSDSTTYSSTTGDNGLTTLTAKTIILIAGAVTGSKSVGVFSNPTASTATCSWSFGPRRLYLTANTAVGNTFIATIAGSQNLYGGAPKVGDYVSSYTAGIPDGTQIVSYDSVNNRWNLSNALTAIIPANTEIILSDKSGTRNAALDYIPVTPNASYAFSGYHQEVGTAYDITFGIRWRDINGAVTGTAATATTTAASQAVTGFIRSSVLATAPTTAVYAEPYISIASMASGASYWVDALQFEGNVRVLAASRTTSTVTLTTNETFATAFSSTNLLVAGLGTGYDGTFSSFTVGTSVINNVSYVTVSYSLAGTAGTLTNVSTGSIACMSVYRDPETLDIQVTGVGTNAAAQKTQYQTVFTDYVHMGRGSAVNTGSHLAVPTAAIVSPTIYGEPSINFANVSATLEIVSTTTARIVSSQAHQYEVGDFIKADGFTNTNVNTTGEYVVVSAVPDAFTFEFPLGTAVGAAVAATSISAGTIVFLDVNKTHTVTMTANASSVGGARVGDAVTVTGYTTNSAINVFSAPIIAVSNNGNTFVYALSGTGITTTTPAGTNRAAIFERGNSSLVNMTVT